MYVIKETVPDRLALTGLYDAVGWSPYIAEPDRLLAAVGRSSYLRTAWHDGQLVGLCRALSDGFIVCYLLDLLVHPDHQRRGLGKRLLQTCLDDHADVRQLLLMTDDRPEQLALYRSAGLKSLRALEVHPLNVFLRIQGVDLR